MRNKLVKTVFLLLTCASYCPAQTVLPVLHSGTGNIDIRDGDHLRKAIWTVMPEKRPDHYYTELPRKPHRVTFISGSDSLSFDCRYGQVYSFIILRGHDSCYTQVVASYKTISQPKGNLPDTIPFIIGSNNKIFIQARLNNGPMLKFQFDFGSDGLSIRTATLDKVKLAGRNQLAVGKLHWDSLKFDVYDHNMKRDEDGLLGNRLFMDKVVELNYDRRLMIIRDTLPDVSGYRKQPMILWGSLPLFRARLGNGSPWLIYDSGDSGQADITEATAKQYGIDNSAHTIMLLPGRKLVRLKDLTVAGVHFPNLPAVISTSGGGDDYSVMGNALLKRFNAIIDNRNGYLYLKPNGLLHQPFENMEFQVYGSMATIVLTIILLYFLIRFLLKKIRKKKLKKS